MTSSSSFPRRRFLALGLMGGVGDMASAAAGDAPPAQRAEAFVDDLVAAQRIPGLALAVMRDGQPQFTRCWGQARPHEPSPVDEGTRFCVGSVSKPVLAQAMLMLALDGRLRLDDPIQRHLGRVPPHWRAITIRQLLNHTAGLRNAGNPAEPSDMLADPGLRQQIQARGGAPFSEAEQLAAFQGFALLSPPGQRFNYSNTGYNVLATLVGRVTGRPYTDMIRQRIFEPLGMDTARFISAETDFADMAAPCEVTADGRVLDISARLTPVQKAFYGGGGGGIQLSLRDLMRWDAGLSGRAVPAQFAAHLASLPRLWDKPVPMEQGPGEDGREPLRYGLGWGVSRSVWGQRKVGHSGFIPGFRANYARYLGDPAAGTPTWSVAVLTNQSAVDPGPIAATVAGFFARAQET